MNKCELRLELTQLTGQVKQTDNGQNMVCEAQSEPIKKPGKNANTCSTKSARMNSSKPENPKETPPAVLMKNINSTFNLP